MNLKGKSGNVYGFTMFTLPADFWKTGGNFKGQGIYIFTKVNANNIHNLIYVGQTNDFSTRFNSHHKEQCIKNQNASHIGLLVENNQKMRDEIEKDLIDGYRWPCNG